jgi:hypothetical protein
MNKPISIQVIPAQQGYFTVYNFDGSIEVDTYEPIIAWRIETYEKNNLSKVFSKTTPITVDGDVVENCIGVQNPNLSISVFEDSTYRSLSDLVKARKLKA